MSVIALCCISAYPYIHFSNERGFTDAKLAKIKKSKGTRAI